MSAPEAPDSVQAVVDDLLTAHANANPVDATFMGLGGWDGRLPPSTQDALDAYRLTLGRLEARAVALPAANSAADRLDARLAVAITRVNARLALERPNRLNPAWYTGEAAFSLISLLLPNPPAGAAEALAARLGRLPEFLNAGRLALDAQATPGGWSARARAEAAALAALLERGLPRHPLWTPEMAEPAAAAARAARAFAESLKGLPERDPACGPETLEFLMREAHGLDLTPREAEALALEGFSGALAGLQARARALDPDRDWREQLAQLEGLHPDLDDVPAVYAHWHQEAERRAAQADLVTPAEDYGLSFEPLPDWAREAAPDLYFLFYRSPPAERPGTGGVYWVFPPGGDAQAYLRAQNTAGIKLIHAVHHGSIGHHTQNARARAAGSRLARLAGTDCASGIAFLPGGSLIEGWACYAEDLMAEAQGFYTPLEELQLLYFELRNAATCLADIRLHSGVWSLAEMERFYTNEVGFPQARARSESIRNSIYPATRLMYWLGTRAIVAGRRASRLSAREYHDRLLSYGSLPVPWALEELRRSEGEHHA